MHESILDFRRYRYLWISLVLCAVAIGLYVRHDPIQPKSGGTWLGYSLGGVAAALIVWLLFLGIRKRAYNSNLGTVRGWTSAHVYLGTSVLVLATLHSAFQFGWNLHTLAYGLMVAVIATGIWGVVMYRRYPQRITDNRGGQTRMMLASELAEMGEECLRRADDAGPEIHAMVNRALEIDPLIKPTWRTLLTGRHWTGRFDHRVDRPIDHKVYRQVARQDARTLEQALTEHLARETDGSRIEALNRLLDAVAQRRRLSARLARDLKLQAWMELWLYLHVPLSVALLATLIAHIVAVFFYW